MQRREHIRIRKPRPSSSEVILMLLLGTEEKSNPRRTRRSVATKTQAGGTQGLDRTAKIN